MQIPILNIYYLLCYAWDKLDESEKISAGISDYREAIDLFTRVLLNGCNQLFKKGLDRDYNTITKTYSGIKGKINFSASINANAFDQGKAVCEFDEFEYNILQNQLLKGTLLRVSKIKELDRKLHKEAKELYLKFNEVEDIDIRLNQFSKVKIHRNNVFYDLLLRVCKMIVEATSLNENDGSYIFKDFIKDEKAMARLFEAFVRNFYRKEQSEYKVSSPKIAWIAEAIGNSNIDLLPEMRTDIVLESDDRKIVMDTKYYQETTAEFYGVKTFHSNNLYQVYSYVKNLEGDLSDARNLSSEGILLYPTVKEEYDQSYIIGGHKIRLATVNLSKDWREIDYKLKQLIMLQ
ncbi:MAG: hypothetical protein RIB47_07015 [Cyclobacteriaceae bacterium]